MRAGYILSENEVAEMTGLTVYTLRRWRKEFLQLPFLRMGKRIGYLETDVRQWIARNRVTPRSGPMSAEDKKQ